MLYLERIAYVNYTKTLRIFNILNFLCSVYIMVVILYLQLHCPLL